MIVPSMNYEETAIEIFSDHVEVFNLYKTKLNIQAAMAKRTNHYYWVETLRVKTKRNNEWRITVNYTPIKREIAIYLKVHDQAGLVAYCVTLLQDEVALVVKYTPHFFRRYNERMNLGLTKPEEILKHFFKNNSAVIPSCNEEEMSDGGRLAFFSFNNGIGLGRFYPEQLTIQMRTYIAGHILNKGQQTQVDFLRKEEEELGYYKKTAFVETAKKSLANHAKAYENKASS